MEKIRKALRDLMKYITNEQSAYETGFGDEILSIEWKQSELENDDLQNYKMRAEFYVRQHQNELAIAKLKMNVPLTDSDITSWRKFSGAKSEQSRITKPSTERSRWASSSAKSSGWI